MRKKRLQKSKSVFSKCVLDFNFAPIKGSVFFSFYKKSNLLYPNHQSSQTTVYTRDRQNQIHEKQLKLLKKSFIIWSSCIPKFSYIPFIFSQNLQKYPYGVLLIFAFPSFLCQWWAQWMLIHYSLIQFASFCKLLREFVNFFQKITSYYSVAVQI